MKYETSLKVQDLKNVLCSLYRLFFENCVDITNLGIWKLFLMKITCDDERMNYKQWKATDQITSNGLCNRNDICVVSSSFYKGLTRFFPKNSKDILDGKACIILVDFRNYSFVGCHSRFLLGKKSTNFNIICYSL